MKPIFITITTALIFMSCSLSKSSLQIQDSIQWIQFSWVEMEIEDQIYEKAGIYIPILINDLHDEVALQFDIGSQTSFLNGNSLKHLLEKDPALLRIDTVRYDNENFDLQLKDVQIKTLQNENIIKGINIRPDEGDFYSNSIDEINFFKVGTMGADVLKDKVLLIDYPNSQLAILEQVPEELKIKFVETIQIFGKINIPAEIRSKKVSLLFDTGASIFQIATTPSGYQFINGNKPTSKTIKVPSFGTYLEFQGAPSDINITIAGSEINKPLIYYSNNEDVINFFKESDIFGLTGNALFLRNVVIIDYRNSRFGIVE